MSECVCVVYVCVRESACATKRACASEKESKCTGERESESVRVRARKRECVYVRKGVRERQGGVSTRTSIRNISEINPPHQSHRTYEWNMSHIEIGMLQIEIIHHTHWSESCRTYA